MIGVLVGVAAFALILYRQLRTRRLNSRNYTVPLVIGLIGVVQTVAYLASGAPVTAIDVAATLLGLVCAAVLAWPRARSQRLWRDDAGQWWMRGTALTVVWWFISLAVHFATSLLVHLVNGEGLQFGLGAFENATLMVYLGVTLGLQTWFRLRRLPSGSPATERVEVPVA